MQPFTRGFLTTDELVHHFFEHRAEFGVPDACTYLLMADRFLGQSLGRALECTRRNGDLVRYNPSTEEFGVLGRDRVIRTYFKPDPYWHCEPDNLVYFQAECRK